MEALKSTNQLIVSFALVKQCIDPSAGGYTEALQFDWTFRAGMTKTFSCGRLLTSLSMHFLAPTHQVKFHWLQNSGNELSRNTGAFWEIR